MAFRLNYISCVEIDVQNAISLSTFLKFYVFIRMHILQRPVITWMLQKRGRFVEYPRSNSFANRCSIAFCGRHLLWVEGWTSIVFIVTSSRSVFSHIIPQSLYPRFGGHEVHCSTQTTVFPRFFRQSTWLYHVKQMGPICGSAIRLTDIFFARNKLFEVINILFKQSSFQVDFMVPIVPTQNQQMDEKYSEITR